MQLEIEEAALKKEKDKAVEGAARGRCARSSPTSRTQADAHARAVGGREGRRIGKVRAAARGDRAGAPRRSSSAERAYDLNRAAELQARQAAASSRRSCARRRPSAASARRQASCCARRSTEEEIAEIVSNWTGIPVTRLVEGEREKLLQPRRDPAPARGRPGRGGAAGRRRGDPRPRRASRTRAGRSARSSSSAPPASARPSWPRRSPRRCSTPRRTWSASTCPSTWRSTPCRA